MNRPPEAPASAQREIARELAQRGELEAAEQAFLQLLQHQPHDTEALRFVADCEARRGHHQTAIDRLQLAVQCSPGDAASWGQLGSARMLVDDVAAAAASFDRALSLSPRMFVARLQQGMALEQLGRSHEALKAYFMAIECANARQRWQDDATTAPRLREAVKHAVSFVNAGRRRLFHGALDPLRQRYGSAELARVEQSLAIYFLDRPANIPDPRQRPKFLYFPGITSQPYYPRHHFPWLDSLEAATDRVRAELRTVLAQETTLESFLGEVPEHALPDLLGSSGEQAPAWDAYFFHRHGQRHQQHRDQCPHTAALLDALPLVRIRDHAPEALFSVLSPGTHILPHTGVTNTRLVTHLPLIVPPDCAIRVGGQEHVWQEGRCVTFDDTWEHEAWNRSAQRRVVLIVDSWHPELSEVERAAITDLVEAIGDFKQSCELPLEA